MKIASEKVVVVLGRAIDAAGSLVFLKLLSSLVEKNDVGQYMLASSYLAVLLTISFSAFDQGLLRNITEYRKQESLAARYSGMLVAYLALSVVLAGLCATMLSAFDYGTALHAVLVPLSLWLIFESLKNLSITVASGLRSRSLIATASAFDYTCRITLLWAAYQWSGISTGTILYLLTASGLGASLVFLWGQRDLLVRFRWQDVRTTLLDSIKFSWPMIIWGLFGWMQNMSNRWLLNRFADLPAVAEYGVLVAIGTFPVTALLGLVVTYAVPILYEHESASAGSSRRVVQRIALALAPLCTSLVLITAGWHRELTTLLSGQSYTGHSHLLPFIMGGACASAICSVFTYAIYAQRRVASLLIANMLPGAFSLTFGYFAVSQHGLDGAVLTLVLSHLVASMLFIAAYVHAGKKHVP